MHHVLEGKVLYRQVDGTVFQSGLVNRENQLQRVTSGLATGQRGVLFGNGRNQITE